MYTNEAGIGFSNMIELLWNIITKRSLLYKLYLSLSGTEVYVVVDLS